MAESDAERKRRSRAHLRGDHSLCSPQRCEQAGHVDLSRPVPRSRGQKLWQDMAGDKLPPAQRVLLEEACRIADRLDQLDRVLGDDGETWLRILEERGDPERQTLVIDKALAEARQQATALKQLIAEIRAAGAAKPEKPAAAGKEVPAGVADLAAFAATRSAKSTG